MSPSDANRAYLSLGSNIRPEFHLPACIGELAKYGRVIAVSRVWQSAPVGDVHQADFLNAAALLETRLTAAELCRDAIPEIETRLDRVRDPHNVNAARTIDIDLSLFNRDVITIDHRTIPDPEMLTRAFVAIPLGELDPDYVHPSDGRTLREIAEAMKEESTITLQWRDDVVLTCAWRESPPQNQPE